MAKILKHGLDIFLIRPVRTITDLEQVAIGNAVASLRDGGFELYDPLIDTDQTQTELSILRQNRAGMQRASEVYLWYSPESLGSIFDLGMAYYFEKPLTILNSELLLKSPLAVQELITTAHQNSRGTPRIQRQHIATASSIPLRWKPTPDRIFYFGMAFASEKEIGITNPDALHRTSKKSFENALLDLTAKATQKN